MADMRKSKKERDDTCCDISDDEEYPWGLRINLDDESMEKLGIDLKDVGDVCVFSATAVVTNVSQSAGDNGEHKDMSLQITDMEIKPIEEADTAEQLYGKD